MMDIQVEDFQISLQEYHSGYLVSVHSNQILHTMFCLNCWVTSQSTIISLLHGSEDFKRSFTIYMEMVAILVM